MINSENSELKQIVRVNIPPNAYFSEEKHLQMFSGACPRHIMIYDIDTRILSDHRQPVRGKKADLVHGFLLFFLRFNVFFSIHF